MGMEILGGEDISMASTLGALPDGGLSLGDSWHN